MSPLPPPPAAGRWRVAALAETGTDVLIPPAGPTLLRTPAGRLMQAADAPAGLADALDAGPDRTPHRAPDPAPADDATAYADRLAGQARALRAADAETRWPAARRRVLVLGQGPVADALRPALVAAGAQLADDPAALLAALAAGRVAADQPAPALVVAVADRPQDRDGWDLLDTAPAHGIAWLRAHREGEVWHVEPLAVTAEDPTSTQVRRRRHAASPAPDALAAWQADAPEPGPADAAAALLTAARILHLALAWAREDDLGAARTLLWRHESTTGRTSEHPVLAYDEPHRPDADGPR